MLAEERQKRVLEILNNRQNGAVSVKELSTIFDTSEMTIRRDLDSLFKRGLIKRVHGGAVSLDQAQEKTFEERYDEYNVQKEGIGRMASRLIEDGDTVIFDAGTTTQQIARCLDGAINLTVITNAMPVAMELCRFPNISTIFLGGILKHKEACTVGPSVIQELARFSVNKLFLTASGFSLEKGVSDPDLREVEVKQAMMRSADEIILVADSSKWDVTTLVKIGSMQSVNTLVTDDGLPGEAVEALKAQGIDVIIADTALEPSE